MADFSFGIEDCKVAPWLTASTWGTALDVIAISQMQLTLVVASNELQGDDIIVAAGAKISKATVTIQFAFRDLDVAAVLAGGTHASSDTDEEWTFGDGSPMPTFAIAGKTDDFDGAGNRVIWLPKCKIVSDFSYDFQYENFATPQLTITAFSNGSPYYAGRILQYAANTPIAIPPTAIPT